MKYQPSKCTSLVKLSVFLMQVITSVSEFPIMGEKTLWTLFIFP